MWRVVRGWERGVHGERAVRVFLEGDGCHHGERGEKRKTGALSERRWQRVCNQSACRLISYICAGEKLPTCWLGQYLDLAITIINILRAVLRDNFWPPRELDVAYRSISPDRGFSIKLLC